MKIKLFVVAAGLLLFSMAASAQKIGYVEVEKIFSNMPDTKQANTQLQEYEQQLGKTLQAKYQDYQTKLAEYQQTAAGLSDILKKDKETELKNLESSIRQFEQNAQQSVTEKQQTLLAPIQKKLSETIEQVANENGYTHVFSYGAALVFVKDKSGNISELVAQKLGFSLPQ